MPERVLLVEDRESLRGLLHRALVAGRFEVVAVGDAETAAMKKEVAAADAATALEALKKRMSGG